MQLLSTNRSLATLGITSASCAISGLADPIATTGPKDTYGAALTPQMVDILLGQTLTSELSESRSCVLS